MSLKFLLKMIRAVFKKLIDRHIYNHYESPEVNGFLFGGIGAVGGLFCATPSDNFAVRASSLGFCTTTGATVGFLMGSTLGPVLIMGTGIGLCATSLEKGYVHIEKILTVSS
jgi:hypothetical protein